MKRCTAFLLSDFIAPYTYKDAMTIANRKHDIAAIQVYDRRLVELPRIGLMKVRDAESGEEMYIDTSSDKVQKAQRNWWQTHSATVGDILKKSRIDTVSVRTDHDYVKALLSLFAQRG